MRANVTRAAEGFDRRSFTVAEILRMQDAGIIADDENFELIEGEIVPMQAKTHVHELIKSALNIDIARALPDYGKVITLERDMHMASVAKTFLARDPAGGRIEILLGDAHDTMPGLHEIFDMVFIDADKAGYPAYVDLALPLLRKTGLLVIDNLLMGGLVAEGHGDEHWSQESVDTARALNERLTADPGLDFVLVPIVPAELYARLRQLDWRFAAFSAADRVKVGELEIDISAYEAHLRDRKLDLTHQEFELLKYLAQNRGKVWTREQLLSKVWGYRYFGGTRTVDIHVRRLRAKVGDALPLETLRGAGYKLRAPSEAGKTR